MVDKQEQTELKYRMTYDALFKLYFVKHPDYLKRVVGMMLKMPLDSITEFAITNSEIPPEQLGDKFCRLDINMTVNGQRVDLEIQVEDEHDYAERSLYYWARDYSSALPAAHKYKELPRVIIINILAFPLFDCVEFHSEFRALEVTRHEELCDKQVLHYYELTKLPEPTDGDEEIKFWLAFFKAQTEEDLDEIIKKGVPVMSEAVAAYKNVTVSPEFREIERVRELARHNEAAALSHAAEVAAKAAREERDKEISKRMKDYGLAPDLMEMFLMN